MNFTKMYRQVFLVLRVNYNEFEELYIVTHTKL